MTQEGKLKVTEHKNDVTVVSFLDVAILDEVSKASGEQLEEIAKSKEGINLVVDFSNVDYLSSAVLGKLVKVRKIVVKQQNGKMKLCGIKSNILQVFKITKLDKLFEIHPNEEKAIKSFKKPFKLFGR